MNDWQPWSEEMTRHTLDTFSRGAIEWGDDPLGATHFCEKGAAEMPRRGNEIRRWFDL